MEIKSPTEDKKYSSGILDKTLFLQRIILQNGIGRGINNVVSVMKMKQYNICFLSADSREWYEFQSMRLGAYQNLTTCLICSGAGLMKFLKIISHQYFWARQPCVGLFGYAEMRWCSIKKIFLFAGYLLNYALVPYMGYPSEVYFAGQACSSLSFLGTGGQGFFCPGTWVAV